MEADITVEQISVYSNPTSTDVLEVEINGAETKYMFVPPGNTINFLGQNIKSVKISVQGKEFTYVEGKYNIASTLQFHMNRTLDRAQ